MAWWFAGFFLLYAGMQAAGLPARLPVVDHFAFVLIHFYAGIAFYGWWRGGPPRVIIVGMLLSIVASASGGALVRWLAAF